MNQTHTDTNAKHVRHSILYIRYLYFCIFKEASIGFMYNIDGFSLMFIYESYTLLAAILEIFNEWNYPKSASKRITVWVRGI